MLLDRADRDIYNAKWLISPSGNPSNDELLDDIAAYHAQQGIEKALKYALKTICGFDEAYKGYRTHDIMALIKKMNSNKQKMLLKLKNETQEPGFAWAFVLHKNPGSLQKTGTI